MPLSWTWCLSTGGTTWYAGILSSSRPSPAISSTAALRAPARDTGPSAEHAPPYALDVALGAYRTEGRHLAATERAVDLVERALLVAPIPACTEELELERHSAGAIAAVTSRWSSRTRRRRAVWSGFRADGCSVRSCRHSRLRTRLADPRGRRG